MTLAEPIIEVLKRATERRREEKLELAAGDYTARLRRASNVKENNTSTAWGGMDIYSGDYFYWIHSIDHSHTVSRIERDGQSVEELVELFDEQLLEQLEEE